MLHESVEFDPAGDFDQFLRAVPARWVVYLMSAAESRPVQLLCVRNLRQSLKRRLGIEQPEAPRSKRVNYRELVRQIRWRRVDSAFEADSIYLEAARTFFPDTYQGMTGFQPAWFIHVNVDADFPRYTKTIDLSERAGTLIGPIEDKNSAGKLIEEIADWFDLCRYYHILVESPHAKACAYKEMGKCPAPCDGSISMEQYRRLVQWSAEAIVNPDELIRDNKERMQEAAAELDFESAAKIKSYVDSLSQLGKGSLRYLRRLPEFNFLSLQRGPREGTAKLFLIRPGVIDEIAGLIAEPKDASDLLELVSALASQPGSASADQAGAQRIGVVAHHLFAAKATHGVFLHIDSIDAGALAKGYRELLKQNPPSDDAGEGVIKELHAL